MMASTMLDFLKEAVKRRLPGKDLVQYRGPSREVWGFQNDGATCVAFHPSRLSSFRPRTPVDRHYLHRFSSSRQIHHR